MTTIPTEWLRGLSMFDLTGCKAIVTGGSRGLGTAMATALSSCGATVLVTARKSEHATLAAQSISQATGKTVLGLPLDIGNSSTIPDFANEALNQLGGVDILVNNAGINIRGPIGELSLDNFREVLDINVSGLWYVTKHLVPAMKAQRYGRIINMASALGTVGLANRTPYTSSKGAVVQMTRALAIELAQDAITVNAICPGPFLTPMNEPIQDSEEAQRHIVGATALGRWARLEEIQSAIVFLASRSSSYCTGALLAIDGGWTAR